MVWVHLTPMLSVVMYVLCLHVLYHVLIYCIQFTRTHSSCNNLHVLAVEIVGPLLLLRPSLYLTAFIVYFKCMYALRYIYIYIPSIGILYTEARTFLFSSCIGLLPSLFQCVSHVTKGLDRDSAGDVMLWWSIVCWLIIFLFYRIWKRVEQWTVAALALAPPALLWGCWITPPPRH